MKKDKWAVAGLVLSATSAMASDSVPAICENVANYAAQAAHLSFSDGGLSDKYNPASLKLKSDFDAYPITSEKNLGDCDALHSAWCQVAGGEPELFEIDFGKTKVTVTYNRGSCWVDEATND